MTTEAEHPSLITGGCLCGSIRYDVSFGSCQCTMCRKWTGCLYPQFLTVSLSQVSPALPSFPAYKEFPSSPGCLRGFCSDCGSSLVWKTEKTPDELALFIGTLDEKWLIGEKGAGTEKPMEHGIRVHSRGGLGELLATPRNGQYYFENAIEGVTDGARGKKYLTHPSIEEGFD
ncbi:hypothetical protein ASPZODRAFT_462982 [Penicilliopsis zonata CBS 506.65]|uniref:CENP-V/GFA domain-containing protein n=1 Tax=Penicilliopsis zonata CBS 506.65 TaxID=1073090 RepID=A0A1L9SX40_9EURO|nr:hypothetical protein ASPZODRAFT_462982 [Penicilliopsis zonata CBS 506.65]OJJ51754.1 hypothetical protein ASPZODRAFT_462982 [Penicilliopsis zonata CBS 506.65]